MTFRNPLRQGSAVLFCTAVAACLGGTVGCDVYEEELLRRRDDDPAADAARGTTDAGKIGTPADASQRNDTGPLDASTPDFPSVRDGGTRGDTNDPEEAAIDGGAPGVDANVPTPDGASSDVSPDGALRDANAKSDAFDATHDAPPSPRDVDAAPPNSDASDDAPRDASTGTDSNPSDGNGSGPDVQPDAVTPPPPTIRVVRLGDGSMSLSSASAPVFIEERRWDGSIVGSAIALPTAKSGPQQALTMAGNATSEGALSLSLDGRYLMLAGYGAAPGRAAIATSSDVDRVVATVDASGTVDTTTSLGNVFLGTNARSAVSVDGTGFWVGGQSGGVWYFPHGGGAGTQIVTEPDNVRLVALFGDRLYGSSGSSPTSVFTVGSGRPTTGTQNVTALVGMPQSGSSPYAFVLFDRTTTIGGLDTLYLADDRDPERNGNGGGVQKWTLDGGRWSQVATFVSVGGGMASFRGLTGTMTASGAALVASTWDTTGNRLVLFLDDGTQNVTGKIIATAPPNTIFRGVALSPHP